MVDTQTQNGLTKWQFRFFTIWIGQAFSMLGSHLVGFAFVWYLTDQTGSATILAVGSLMNLIPSIVIGPIAGAFVDRWNRKVVMAVFDSITALFTLLIAILFIFDFAQIWHIFLVMFIRSTCGQFQWAAMIASTSLMVPRQYLSRVAGANQTLQGLMNIIAPALGALFISLMPIQGILFVDVFTAALAVGPLLFFTIPQPQRNGTQATVPFQEKTSIWQDFSEGWKYVTGWPGLMAIIFLAMMVNFLVTPAFTLLPLVVTEHFSKGAYELGFINSAFGIGVIVGGLVLSAWGGFKNQMVTSLVALTTSGWAVLVVGLASPSMYLLALVGMALFGFLIQSSMAPLWRSCRQRLNQKYRGVFFHYFPQGPAWQALWDWLLLARYRMLPITKFGSSWVGF
jgi:MFS transporter, DHA3 family, macrolide efflux protein